MNFAENLMIAEKFLLKKMRKPLEKEAWELIHKELIFSRRLEARSILSLQILLESINPINLNQKV